MKTSDEGTVRLWLLDAIERLEAVISLMDARERVCKGCKKSHYVNLTEGRAAGTLQSAVTRIKKGAREAGLNLEK